MELKTTHPLHFQARVCNFRQSNESQAEVEVEVIQLESANKRISSTPPFRRTQLEMASIVHARIFSICW